MEKKLISIAKKLSDSIKSREFSGIMDELKTISNRQMVYFDVFFPKPIAKSLVQLGFLIHSIKNFNDIEIGKRICESLYFFTLFTSENVHPERTCQQCDGNGEEYCEYCDDGKITCGDCNGNGSVDCDKCNGDGEIELEDGTYETCDDCDEGKIECSSCDGDGDYNCNECDGDGRVTCNECDGDGEITVDGYEYTLWQYCAYSKELYKTLEESNTMYTPICDENVINEILGRYNVHRLNAFVHDFDEEIKKEGKIYCGILTDAPIEEKNIPDKVEDYFSEWID